MRVLVAHLGTPNGGNVDLAALYSPSGPFGPVTVRPLTRRRLALGYWDIVHVYWPEWCVRRDSGALLLAVDAILFLALLGWARVRGARVVWSANNLRPHERDRAGLVDRYIVAFMRLVDGVHATSDLALRTVMDTYPSLAGALSVIAPLGHYRDCYPPTPLSREEARKALRLPPSASIALAIGRMRPYKNVPELVESHRRATDGDPGTFLLIAGECPSDVLSEQIKRACGIHEGMRADLHFIPSSDITTYLQACDFVVVSSHSGFNSGVAVLALSFHRPVLLPNTEALHELVERHGAGWTMTFDGEISPAALRAAHAKWRTAPVAAEAPMPSWSTAAEVLLAAFRAIRDEPVVS